MSSIRLTFIQIDAHVFASPLDAEGKAPCGKFHCDFTNEHWHEDLLVEGDKAITKWYEVRLLPPSKRSARVYLDPRPQGSPREGTQWLNMNMSGG